MTAWYLEDTLCGRGTRIYVIYWHASIGLATLSDTASQEFIVSAAKSRDELIYVGANVLGWVAS